MVKRVFAVIGACAKIIFAQAFSLVLTMMLSLSGCGDKNVPPALQAEKAEKLHVAKPDYQKAAMLNVELGEAYLGQGNIARAKQKFMHALKLKPEMPEAHSSLAYFYETVNDVAEAELHHKEAINYGDGKGRFYNNYGTFLCRQGRYNEADRAFNKALQDKQYIKTADVYENAGLCALQQPDMLGKAYEYLQTAIMRDPKRAQASLELSSIEVKRRNYIAAADYLNLFKTHNKPSARALWLTIQTYRALSKSQQVADAAAQLKQLFPESEEYKAYLESDKHE